MNTPTYLLVTKALKMTGLSIALFILWVILIGSIFGETFSQMPLYAGIALNFGGAGIGTWQTIKMLGT